VKNYKEYLVRSFYNVSTVTFMTSFNEEKSSNTYFEEWKDAPAGHTKPTGVLHMPPLGQP
jgi:hypothetical protein